MVCVLFPQIRAKEARKQEESMLRTPADEKKKERMSRLPELVRIIRKYPLPSPVITVA